MGSGEAEDAARGIGFKPVDPASCREPANVGACGECANMLLSKRPDSLN
jgi:hypothetical protein